MAGATLDRKLNTAGASSASFALATQADDADIRRLLQIYRFSSQGRGGRRPRARWTAKGDGDLPVVPICRNRNS